MKIQSCEWSQKVFNNSLHKNNIQILKYCNTKKGEKFVDLSNTNEEKDVISKSKRLAYPEQKNQLPGLSLISLKTENVKGGISPFSKTPNNSELKRIESEESVLKSIAKGNTNFSDYCKNIVISSPFKNVQKKFELSKNNGGSNISSTKGFRPLMSSLGRQILGGIFNFETVGLKHDLKVSKEDIPLLLAIYKTTVDLTIGNVPKQKYPQETLKFKSILAREADAVDTPQIYNF